MFKRLAFLCVSASVLVSSAERIGQIPPGFTSIFNGKDLSGWHVSEVNHHGNTKGFAVKDGVLTATQDRPGNGGVLLSDKRYGNFEIYLEVKPDWGCDSGVFLRANEKGEAYQALLDYLPKGNVGGVYGEGLKDVKYKFSENWEKVWRKDDWNSYRARIEGDVPHITVWINGTQVVDFQDVANHSMGGATEGMIGLQVHGGPVRWHTGGYHRFRNIAIKKL